MVLSDLLLEAQLDPVLYECRFFHPVFTKLKVRITYALIDLDVSTIKASSNDLLGMYVYYMNCYL